MPEEVVTDPYLIQEHIKNHFKNQTRPNPYNDQDQANWQDEYKPKNNILPNQYNTILQDITLAELKNCIVVAPNKKATGPQLISNKMLKHLDEQILNYLLNIFNACLKLEDIPSAWKYNLIYPISKKPIFTGQLNHT